MPALTPHVGVRTLLTSVEQTPFFIADQSTIGLLCTGDDATVSAYPLNTPVLIRTDDATAIGAAGTTGQLAKELAAIASEGVAAQVVVVRVAHNADLEAQLALLVGSAAAKTGAWAFLDAEALTGVAPDILIAPGWTGTRPGNAANAVSTALDSLCDRIITAVHVADGPNTTNAAAATWAADFAETMNVICVDPAVRRTASTVAPASTHVAALMVRKDKERGGPYGNPGNQPMKGIVGSARPIGFQIHDTDSEHNYLLQRGVCPIVNAAVLARGRPTALGASRQFYGFFTTSSDPLWRDIKVVRVRKAVREVLPRTLARYVGQDLGAHLVTIILQSIEEFLRELAAPGVRAIYGGRVLWDRAQNSNAQMRTGGLQIVCDFEEVVSLVDLALHVGRYEAAFDILAEDIIAAMAQYNVRGQLPA